MSDSMQQRLQSLEADYFDQPLVAQRADLEEINRIRSALGLALVDAFLKEQGATAKTEITAAPPVSEPAESKEVLDLAEAKGIYGAYLKKLADLEVHRVYAEHVADATAGTGQTPVRPLATMGTNGGPLLCDYCGKPMVLEGGPFHGVNADEAWKKNPVKNWTSWILGGMVVEIHTNGTLRIYHGYPGHGNHYCCNIASRNHEKALAEFESGAGDQKKTLVRAYLDHEFGGMTDDERANLVNKVLDTLYGYDPGIGINRPTDGS